MEIRPSFSIYMSVGQRIWMHLAERRMRTTVRGWKPPQAILVDIPETDDGETDLREGMKCQIQYMREGTLHSFDTTVLGFAGLSSEVRFLGLSFPDRIRSRSLRSSPRIRIEIPAKVVAAKEKNIPCSILDLSRSGCRIEITEVTFDPEDEFEISCLLPNQKPLVDVACVVRRDYGDGRYGIEFKPLTKPHSAALEEFLRIFASIQATESTVQVEHGMTGELEEVTLPDLLQILASSRKSYHVELREGSRSGEIYLKDGEIIRASTSELEGEQAVLFLLSWSKGRYHIQRADTIPEENVNEQLEQILFEYAYQQDRESLTVDEALLDTFADWDKIYKQEDE
jgi:hypothetical protein